MSHFRHGRQFISFVLMTVLLLFTNLFLSQDVIFASPLFSQHHFVPTAALALPTDTDTNQSSSLFGLVWSDLNRNGKYDAQEPLLSGETVFITPDGESDFAQILVFSTDQQGQFYAGTLTAGRYRVWTHSQAESDALVITITEDRTVLTVELPQRAFIVYMPNIQN